jgi:ketosteroid isomerase-like protein
MKRMIFPSVILFVAVCIMLCSRCQSDRQLSSYRTADSLAISQAIYDCIGWAGEKDFALLYSVIVNDSSYLEVDPGAGVIKGIAEFRKNEAFWGSPDFKAIRYDIRDLTISISQKNDAAWFYCILDDVNEWKGQPACWMNTRWTGVLEKRNGKWMVVQQHFSFASEK